MDTLPMADMILDTDGKRLVKSLLSEKSEPLSKKEKSLLSKNRTQIIAYLNTIFSTEVPEILRGTPCPNPDRLF